MNRWQRRALEIVLGRVDEGFRHDPKPMKIMDYQDEKAARALVAMLPDSLDLVFLKGHGHFLIRKCDDANWVAATISGHDEARSRAKCVEPSCDGQWHKGWDGHDPYCHRCPVAPSPPA